MEDLYLGILCFVCAFLFIGGILFDKKYLTNCAIYTIMAYAILMFSLKGERCQAEWNAHMADHEAIRKNK